MREGREGVGKWRNVCMGKRGEICVIDLRGMDAPGIDSK